jgi:hypothetical protein
MTSSVSHHPWPMRVGPLVLREAGEEDIEQLLSLRNDPGVNRFMLRTSVDAYKVRLTRRRRNNPRDTHL